MDVAMNNQGPMSDDKRRMICRLSFLLSCVVPTLLVFYLILHPFSNRDWEQLLEANLGLDVEIEAVERTGPWNTILRGVVLRGESDEESVSATEVQIMHGSRIEISINPSVQLTAAMARRLARSSNERLMRRNQLDRVSMVNLRQVELVEDSGASRSKLFRNVQWYFGPYKNDDGDGMGSILIADMAPSFEGKGGQLKLFSGYGPQPGAVTYELFTNNNELEGWVLGSTIPNTPSFINETRFSGSIKATCESGSCVAKIRGYLNKVQLEQLEPSRGLTGDAWFSIRDCQIVNGKIRSLDGAATCTNGMLSPGFVQFLEQDLGLAYGRNAGDGVGYKELLFQVRLDGGKLTLQPHGEKKYLAYGVDRPLFRWDGYERPLDLSRYVLQSRSGIAGQTGNQAVKILGHFDLPDPLPVRVADQRVLSNQF